MPAIADVAEAGDYLWNADSAVGPDGFRSLRGLPTTSSIAAIAAAA